MASLQERAIGAMRLDVRTYEEVEHDQSATGQAALVVLAGAISSGLATRSLFMTVLMVVVAFIGWGIGSYVLLLVGTKLLPGRNTQADLGQVLRTTGFAMTPRVFGILGIIPILGWLIGFAIGVWILVAFVVAVRQAFDYDDTLRAVIVALITGVIILVLNMIVVMLGLGAAFAGASML